MPDPEIHRLREFELVRFIAELLTAHPQYSDVRTEPQIDQRLRPDLTATRKLHRGTERLVIEVKATPFMRARWIETTIRQIRAFRNAGPFDTAALVLPGRLRARDRSALGKARVEIWDIDHVASTFADEIRHQRPSPLTRLYSRAKSTTSRTETD